MVNEWMRLPVLSWVSLQQVESRRPGDEKRGIASCVFSWLPWVPRSLSGRLQTILCIRSKPLESLRKLSARLSSRKTEPQACPISSSMSGVQMPMQCEGKTRHLQLREETGVG